MLTDPEVTRTYTTDWTGRFVGWTPVVIRPRDTAEVAAVVGLCRSHRTAIVPQGGNTGLVGGGVPLGGEVVLSLARLDHIGPVDDLANQVIVGAGVTLAQVQAVSAASDLEYAVDLAARDTATVGGTIATNAGGLHVLRWGATRRQVLGVEAVLGDGSVISHLGGLTKDNTGYDLAGLLCGSEGTLGIVTAACLALIPRRSSRVVALCAVGDTAAAVAATVAVRRSVPGLDAAELFLEQGLDLVTQVTGRAAPFPDRHPAYLLLEVSGDQDPTEELATAIAGLDGIRAVAVATDGERRRALWSYREEHTSAINSLGAPHKLDVTLPLTALADFVEQVPDVVASVAPQARTWLFGHVGDGNVHVNVTGVDPAD